LIFETPSLVIRSIAKSITTLVISQLSDWPTLICGIILF
jgi:hypothetical protein